MFIFHALTIQLIKFMENDTIFLYILKVFHFNDEICLNALNNLYIYIHFRHVRHKCLSFRILIMINICSFNEHSSHLPNRQSKVEGNHLFQK